LEDGEMFEDEEKFWEEMNLNKGKMEVEEEKMEKEEIKEEKMENKVKEEKMEKEEQKPEIKEQKPKVKKQYINLYNKYKKKREDEDIKDYKIFKKRAFLDTSSIDVNNLEMMRRACMRSSKNIRPSSLDIISSWKE
jgi:hypothetical protein